MALGNGSHEYPSWAPPPTYKANMKLDVTSDAFILSTQEAGAGESEFKSSLADTVSSRTAEALSIDPMCACLATHTSVNPSAGVRTQALKFTRVFLSIKPSPQLPCLILKWPRQLFLCLGLLLWARTLFSMENDKWVTEDFLK